VSTRQAAVVSPTASQPNSGAVVSSAPATHTNIVSAVLSVLSAPFGASGNPVAPVESPAVWVLAAAARRQYGQAQTLRSDAVSANATTTNLPPVPGDNNFDATNADPVTGAVTGLVAASDPEGHSLTYTLKQDVPAGQGALVFNKSTGAFTYTPTAAQRVIAGLTPATETVPFTVTVSDGHTKVDVPVTVAVSPTSVAKLGAITAGDGATGIAVTNDRAYVTNYNDGTVTVINTLDGTVVGDPISVGTGPASAAVSSDGSRVYVANSGGLFGGGPGSVSVIDTATNTVIGAPIPVGADPTAIAIAPNGKTVYVANTGDGTVSKITVSTGKVTTVKGVGTDPSQITVAPNGSKVYVSDLLDGTVTEFSSTSSTAKVVAHIGGNPYGLAVSPDSNTLYVTSADGTVTKLETTHYSVIDSFNVGDPASDAVFNNDGTLLAVAKNDGTIGVYDTTTDTLLSTVTLDDSFTRGPLPTQLGISSDGQQVYLTDPSDNSVQVVSLVPVDTKPVANGPVVGSPNPTTGVVAGSIGVTDANHDKLTYTTTAPGKGKVVVNPDGSFTYTPTAAARHAAAVPGAPASDLSDTFTVTVDDGRRGVVAQVVTVAIAPADAVPTAKATAGTPSSSTGVVKGTVTASDADKDVLTYTAPATSDKGGAVTIDSTGRYVYTPTAAARHEAATGAPGATTDSFSVTVDDGHGGTVNVPVTVKISPTNAKPNNTNYTLGSPDSATGAVVGTVTDTDADGDAFTVSGPASTKKGTITYNSANDTFTYTPTAAARAAASAPGASTSTKTDKFTVTVNDGHGGTDTVAATVTIAAVDNHNPTNGSANPGSPDGTTGVVTGSVTATDPDGDPLSYTGPSTSAGGGTVHVSSNGTFTYTPTGAERHAASADGAGTDVTTDTFTVTAGDGRGGTLAIPVTVTVSPKNAAPSGNYTAGTPDAATGLVTGTVTSTDPEGDTRSYSAPATSTKGGTVTVNSSTGAFSYTPTQAARQAAGAPGATAADKTDTFTVTVDDGHTPNGTSTVTVQVNIAPAVATSPSTTGIPGSRVLVGATGTRYQVTNDVDPNTSQLNGSHVSILAADGTVLKTVDIPGAVNPISAATRPDGSLLVTSIATDNGGTTDFSVVSPTGTVTSLGSAPGFVSGGIHQAPNGTAYVQVINLTVSGDGTPTGSSTSIVRISTANTLQTYAETNPSNLPLTVAPDGSAYVVEMNGNQNYSVLAIGPDGSSTTSGPYNPALVGGFATVGSDGKTYITLATPPSDPNSVGTTKVLVFDGTGSTVVQLTGQPMAEPIAGPNGGVYQITEEYDPANQALGDTFITKITAGGATTTSPAIVGLPLGPPRVASDGTVYLVVQPEDGSATDDVAFWHGSGAVGLAPINGTAAPLSTYDGSPLTVGSDGKAYVAYTDSSGGYHVAIVGPSGSTTVRDMPTGAAIKQQVVFAPNGTGYQLVQETGDDGPQVQVVNLSTGQSTAVLPGAVPSGQVDDVFFGSNGQGYVLTSSGDTSHPASAILAFKSDGTTVATVTEPDEGVIPDYKSAPGPVGFSINPVVFAPDGTAYVTFSTNSGQLDPSNPGHAEIWAFTSSGATKVLDVNTALVEPVTIAPDGTVYASVGQVVGDSYQTTVQVITPPSVV
jgi:YVTN family beta-propeller protein/VCBS repeat-containing protein